VCGHEAILAHASWIDGTDEWSGWSPLPTIFGGFDSDPAAVATTANGGILETCAHNAGNRYVCATYSPTGGWNGWYWAGLQDHAVAKPALVRSSYATYLLAVGYASPYHEYASYSVNGWLSWTADVQVGSGYNFLSAPAAVAVTTSPTVFTVGRAGDSHFWFDTGSSAGWDGWTLIQAIYPYSSN
jgi:hypothetical protein